MEIVAFILLGLIIGAVIGWLWAGRETAGAKQTAFARAHFESAAAAPHGGRMGSGDVEHVQSGWNRAEV